MGIRHWVVVGLVLLLPANGVAAAEPPRLEQTEDLLILKIPGKFDEVMEWLKDAIRGRNYFLTGVTHVDEGMSKRAELMKVPFDFAHYKVVGYCTLTIGVQALQQDPHIGAFMPCRFAVYQPKNQDLVTIVSLRPTYMSRVFRSAEVRRLAQLVETDTIQILKAVAGN
jgi:uncharacterized protein (DUF302 family)